MVDLVGDQLEASQAARAFIASFLAVRTIAQVVQAHGGDLDLTLPIRHGRWNGVCEIATKFKVTDEPSRPPGPSASRT